MDRTVFSVETDPADEVIGRLSELDPANPFCTLNYARIRSLQGTEVAALLLKTDGQISSGCLAFRTEGRLNTRFEITSLPPVSEPTIFWDGLIGHCRRSGVEVLNVNSFASAPNKIPDQPRPITKVHRIEYVIDLASADLWSAMNRRSRRMVTRARANGLALRRDSGPTACASHVDLVNRSFDRLRSRGAEISGSITADEIEICVDHGFGEIFQVVKDGEVFSTLMVVKGPTGAYCQSSGTSDEGRELGSSHFIFHETALKLKDEGLFVLNIGGSTDENRGLHEFKAGLGCRTVELESADYYLGSALKRFVSKGVELLGR
ncbi:MAG: hypothetical protein AB7Q37_08140 [Pyrinomonadaceae bacterium]